MHKLVFPCAVCLFIKAQFWAAVLAEGRATWWGQAAQGCHDGQSAGSPWRCTPCTAKAAAAARETELFFTIWGASKSRIVCSHTFQRTWLRDMVALQFETSPMGKKGIILKNEQLLRRDGEFNICPVDCWQTVAHSLQCKLSTGSLYFPFYCRICTFPSKGDIFVCQNKGRTA